VSAVIDLDQLRRLDEERADDDGMAPSSFVHQPGWVTPDATASIPTLQRTADASFIRARDTTHEGQERYRNGSDVRRQISGFRIQRVLSDI
jgi:hypothetical protein